MSLTALQIATAAVEGLGLLEIDSVEADADTSLERQMRETIHETARDLRARGPFPQQKKIYSFDTEALREEYPLPDDFYSPVMDTQYDQVKSELLDQIGDAEFNYYLYGLGGSPSRRKYRIFGPDGNQYTAGGQFKILPLNPDASETISFEYITKNLFIPKYWLPSTAYTSGQYVSANGNIYLCDTNGTSDASTPPSGVTANITDGTTRWDYVSAAYETIVANTDLSLFDDDIMVLGVRYRYLMAKGLEYQSYEAQYEKKITNAQARWRGSVRGKMFGRARGRSYRPSTPGGWSF